MMCVRVGDMKCVRVGDMMCVRVGDIKCVSDLVTWSVCQSW